MTTRLEAEIIIGQALLWLVLFNQTTGEDWLALVAKVSCLFMLLLNGFRAWKLTNRANHEEGVIIDSLKRIAKLDQIEDKQE